MNLRRLLAGLALAAASLAAGGLALDRAFPPDLVALPRAVDARPSTPTAACCAPSRRPTANGGSRPRSTTSIRSISPCSKPTRIAASTITGASIRWPRRVPPSNGSRAAASCRAPRPFPCRPPACSSRGRAALLTKAIQSARALQLEWRYSKREVLAIYLTLAPMGGNLEGVRAASFAYFGKEPKHLNAAEAALLVAIPQSPERAPARPLAGQSRRPRAIACWCAAWSTASSTASLFDKAASRPVPNRRLAMPMHGAASRGMAGRPVARRDRADDAALRIAERAQPARRSRSAASFADRARDRHRGDRQPQRRRRGVAGRLGLFRPRRPGRPGARASLARLGAEAA